VKAARNLRSPEAAGVPVYSHHQGGIRGNGDRELGWLWAGRGCSVHRRMKGPYGEVVGRL
jgi:hypothetical protein